MILELIKDPYIQGALILSIMGIVTVIHYGMAREQKARFYRQRIQIGNAQILGKREKQDDSFATAEAEYGTIAVVADGIGGLVNGKLASSLAVNIVIEEFLKGDVTANIEYFFKTTAKKANQVIADTFGERSGGTTLMIAVMTGNLLHYAFSGDSMIGIYRNQRITPLNSKQNVTAWLEKEYLSGTISKEVVKKHKNNRKLTGYIGHDGYQGIEQGSYPVYLKKGDKIILYTDGVETLGEIAMEEILSKDQHPQDIAEEMVEKIARKQKANQDNATVIIILV